MTVAQPASIDVSPGWQFMFPNGEKGLSVGTQTGYKTFYLSTMMRFEGGKYIIRSISDDAGTWHVGKNQFAMARFLTSAGGRGAYLSEVYLPGGLQRVDVVLQNMSAFASPCYIAFSLRKGLDLIYASSDSVGWLFDTVPISDAALAALAVKAVVRPVFSVMPDWKAGIMERLSWLTDVMTSETGTEQRRSVRRNPRRSIEVNFLNTKTRRARINNFLAAHGQKELLVPLWHEQFRPAGGLTAGTLAVVIPDVTDREIAVGNTFYVGGKNPDDFEVLEVAFVTATGLQWKVGPTRNWPNGSRIIQLRVARIMDPPTLSNLTDRVATIPLRFEFINTETFFQPSWGHCSALFWFVPDRATDIAVDYARMTYVLDNETAPRAVYDPGDRTRISTRLSLKLFGRKKVVAFRRFLAMARGRTTRFWVPSFTEDIELASDIQYGFIFDAKPGGFFEYMKQPQDARIEIGFIFRDHRPPIYRRLVGVAALGSLLHPSAERFSVDQRLPPIAMDEIERIEFVVPSRFDQDVFELKHETDDSAVVLTNVVVRSTEIAGMGPLECFVTSRPYAVVMDDDEFAFALPRFTANASMFSLRFFEHFESYTPTLVDGVFTIIKGPVGNVAPLEHFGTDQPGLLTGNLRTVLRTLPDQLDHFGSNQPVLVDGVFARLLLSYSTGRAEAIGSSLPILTAGTLT